MNELLQNLVRLQSLEFGDVKVENAEASAAKLRAKIPQPILSHYDRLIARGKRGMAMVRDQVCTGCHMRLPMAVIMTLMHDRDIQLCDSCGRYLYLADPKPPSRRSLQSRPRRRGSGKRRCTRPERRGEPLLLDEVTQVLEFDGEVDVVDHHLLRNRENDRRKVQDARDAGADQVICHFLRGGGRHGEDGHLDT